MQRVFIVTGFRPAYDKKVNDFLKACDLGTEGAFVKFANKLTCNLNPEITQEQLDRQPIAIKESYEQLGCIKVTVIESEVMPTA